MRRSGTDVADELASLVAGSAYCTTRRELYGGERPMWDWWEDALPEFDIVTEWGVDEAA